jgi:hypothetical protein
VLKQETELNRLYEMRDKGELSEDEFREARSKLFASNQESMQREVGGSAAVQTGYGVAKTLIGIQTIVGYALVLVGIVFLVVGLSGGISTAGSLVAGAILMIGGVVNVGLAQMTSAVVDTADYSREIFLLLKPSDKQSVG